jgi:hypothetical protein
MKMFNCQANTYQRQQFLQFFNQLQSLSPFRKKFTNRKFRQLLFFPVVNAIQETKRGPWIIQIAVAEPLMKDDYPFHLLPSFFVYISTINLQVKLSIIRSFAEEPSSQKTYLIRSFLNQYKKRSHSIQAQFKQDIFEQFNDLLKYKIIQPKFKFSMNSNDNNSFVTKKDIQLKDIQTANLIYFYETIYPI